MNINEFRKAYPQYDDINDEQLAAGLRSKLYPDLSQKDFDSKFFAGAGSVMGDVGTSLKSGIVSLAQTPSNLVGLVSGNYDTLGGKALRETQQELQGKYSPLYKQQQREMERNIKAREGEANQFATAIGEYISNPRVLFGETVKQVPQLGADIAAGFGAGAVGRRVAVKAAEKAAEGAVKRELASQAVKAEEMLATGAMRTEAILPAVDTAAVRKTVMDQAVPEILKKGQDYAMNTATGLMAGMQGGDVAQNTYQAVYDAAIKRGMSEEKAKEIAASQARAAGLMGGAASFASMRMLPGIEKSLFGRAARTAEERAQAVTFLERLKAGQGAIPGAVKGFAGEAGQEMFEEGSGQLAQNLALTAVNPDQKLSEGMGQTLAQAGLLGGILGGPVGAIQGVKEAGGVQSLTEKPTEGPGVVTAKQLETVPTGTATAAQEKMAKAAAAAAARRAAAEEKAKEELQLVEEVKPTITPETPNAPQAQVTPAGEGAEEAQAQAPIETQAGPTGAGVPSEVGAEGTTGRLEPSVGMDDTAGGVGTQTDTEPSGGALGLAERDATGAVEATEAPRGPLEAEQLAQATTAEVPQTGLTDVLKDLRGFTQEELVAAGLKPKSTYVKDLLGVDLGEAASESQLKTHLRRIRENNTISRETKDKLAELIQQRVAAFRAAQATPERLARPAYESRLTQPQAPAEPEIEGPPVQQVLTPQNVLTAQGETTRNYTPNLASASRTTAGSPSLLNATPEAIAEYEAQNLPGGTAPLIQKVDKATGTLGTLDADNKMGVSEELGAVADALSSKANSYARMNNTAALTELGANADAVIKKLQAAMKLNRQIAQRKKPDPKKAQEAIAKLDEALAEANQLAGINIMARAGQPGVQGMAKSAVQSIVDRIVKGWKRDVVVKVVNFADLPAGFRAALEQNNLGTAKGFIDENGHLFILADNNANEADVKATLFHEALGHFGLRDRLQGRLKEVMRQIYNTNVEVRRSANAWLEAHKGEYPEEGKIERAVEEVLADASEQGEVPVTAMQRVIALFRDFARRIGFPLDYSDADVAALLRSAHNRVISVQGKALLEPNKPSIYARKVSKKDENIGGSQVNGIEVPLGDKTAEPMDEDVQKKVAKKSAKKAERAAKVAKPTITWYDKWVANFQNDRRALLKWEDAVKAAGKFVSDMAGKFNNIYEQITLSSGVAEDIFKSRVAQYNRQIDNLAVEISKALGKDLDEAREIAGNYLAMIHEPERRMVKYLLSANLSGAGEEARSNLVAPLINNKAKELTDAEIEPIRQQLEDIVFNDPENFSDPNAFEFNVTGIKLDNGKSLEVTPEVQQALLASYQQMFDASPKAREAFTLLQDNVKQLNQVTTDLRKEANHIGPQAANIMKLYGFTNYVPFRGRPQGSKNETLYDFVEQKFGGELQDQEHSFGGRFSPPENPMLRVMVEGAKASIQLARQNVTQAIYNASGAGDGTLDAEVVQKSKFDERFTLFKSHYTRDENGKRVIKERPSNPLKSGDNLIYHYIPNGEIAVIKIKDNIMNESIRRTYRGTVSPLWDLANNLTSFMGQSHTRYNPAFGIMNYVRDALTNIFAMYAEHGFKAGNTLAANIAADVTTGRLAKAAKVAFMYEKGDLEGMRKLAQGDSYVQDMVTYLENGGKVSYIGGLSTQSQMDELNKLVSKNPMVQAKRKLDFVLDRWVDTFEFSSRVAAYRAAKGTGMNDVEATAYAKNLANFEQIGMYGKQMGSLFMFFRQSATGAVRAIDALSKGKYGKQTAALAIGLGFTMYMISLMMSGDDEEGRNRTAVDDMQRWQRYARFHIFGLEDPVQIPWGFGLGAFAATGAQLAGLMFNPGTSYSEFGRSLASIFSGSFSPISFSQAAGPLDNPALFLADTIAPSAFKPLVEMATNVDGLGREIYGNRFSRYSDAYVASDSAPNYLRDFATTLFNYSGGSLDVSPGTLNFIMSTYLDGFGRVINSADGIARSAFSDREIRPIKDTLLFASFQGKGSDPDAKKFAALNSEIDDSMRKIRSIEKDPNRFALWMEDEDHQREYARAKAFNSMVNQGLDDIRTVRNQIRLDSTLTAQQRADSLKELRAPMNMMKRQIMEAMQEI